jgi:hypothetical protein
MGGWGWGEMGRKKKQTKWDIHGQLCKVLGFQKGLALHLGLIRKSAFEEELWGVGGWDKPNGICMVTHVRV